MAIEHTWIYPDILHTRYLGRVTGEELIQSSIDAAADLHFEKIRYVIGDWREVTEALVNPDHIRELAAYIVALSRSFPSVKNASIVAQYESGEARATLYDILTEDASWQTATFGSMEAAKAWLGIDHSELK